MELVIAHGDEIVALWIKAHSLVEGALFVGRADGPKPAEDIRVICDKLVRAEADKGTCRKC